MNKDITKSKKQEGEGSMQQIVSKPASNATQERFVHINFDKDIIIQGVSNIIESNESEIVMTMPGNTLTLSGEKFNIDIFDVSKNYAQISGSLSNLHYSKGREKLSFLKRIIK